MKALKYAPLVAGGLLGFVFVASGIVYFLKLVAMPPPPAGSPAAMFMGALMPTGYMDFIKVIEILGGLLVAVPKTRNFGLLCLGPIIVNIAAFHAFVEKAGLFDPPLIVIGLLALYLLWNERRRFAGLLN